MRKLKFVGLDSWDRPVYTDEKGKLWKDINLGQSAPYLHSATNNEFDGEPEYPIKDECIIVDEYKESPHNFQYMMLGMMKSRCDYYLGYGNRNPHHLSGEDVTSHISAMKRRWNALPHDCKPEWLTWEQILEYEAKMLNPC